MTVPETRFAKNGDVHIAYQVVGEGPIDLVYFGATVSHVELIWEQPSAARFLERLASFSRLIMFDKRGVGMSDPVTGNQFPTLEERLDDVRAVMNAAGSDEAVLFGNSEGGALAVLMATAHPGRVSGLVLFSCYARLAREPDYPYGIPLEAWGRTLAAVEASWGSPDVMDVVFPSLHDDEASRQSWSSFARRATTVGGILTQLQMNYETDVSHLLPLVQAPTLVLHGKRELWVRPEHGRYLAEHTPGARYVELATADHLPFTDAASAVADEIQEFLTGTREAADPDRMLTTVLFTDVVDSTARAAGEGDLHWRELLDRHDQIVRRELERYRGQEVRHTGDGFLATFDGPARAIRCGRAIAEDVRDAGLEVRVGIHTGEVEVRGPHLDGIAVHIGARVAAEARPGEILVSQAIPPLVVGSGLEFEDRGSYELRGVPGQWQLFRVATD
ncbi:MAG: adenylate/guanylate cyclase domain-containing protein [Acidimicrobiia bacterium]